MTEPLDISPYRGYIESALPYGGDTHTYEDVVAGIHAGTLQFWPGAHSVIITEILTFPQRKLLNIFLAAGDLKEIERMQPVLQAWSETQGCDGAIMFGRRGWERTFVTRTGWVSSLVCFRKEYGIRRIRR